MTVHDNYVFDALMELALSETGGSPFIACDLVDQEVLCGLQNKLAALLLVTGTKAGRTEELIEKFPYYFSSRPTGDRPEVEG
jgi:hypothetical protein